MSRRSTALTYHPTDREDFTWQGEHPIITERWASTPDWLQIALHELAFIGPWIAATKGERCVYCADPARALDHIVPERESGKAHRARVPLVPACIACNSTLSFRCSTPVIAERRTYLANMIRRRLAEHDEHEMACGCREDRNRHRHRQYWSLPVVDLRRRLLAIEILSGEGQ